MSDDEIKHAERNVRREFLAGKFRELLSLVSTRDILPKDVGQVQHFVDHFEYGIAFSELKAVLVQAGVTPNADELLLLNELSDSMKLGLRDWNGLPRS